MNKKIVKIILIISGVLLLSGLGIYGYKYIKNKNSHKNTNENENQLKEVSNLSTAFSNQYAGSYKITGYYNKVDLGRTCLFGTESGCTKDMFYGTIYVNDSIKLKSSWVFYIHEEYDGDRDMLYSYSEYIKGTASYSNYILLKIGTYYYYYGYYNGNDGRGNYYPYTKIFNATTGDMIFEVPTNSNEKINMGSYYVGGSSSWNGNMVLDTFSGSGTIYYAKSNYNLTNGNNVEIHKVTFNSNNTYTDSIYGYTKATITTNS